MVNGNNKFNIPQLNWENMNTALKKLQGIYFVLEKGGFQQMLSGTSPKREASAIS